MAGRGPRYLLTIAFLTLIGAVAPFQALREIRQGESPQALDVLRRAPSAASLRSFECDLEDQSVVTRVVRPPTQYLRYRIFGDTGEQALVGRHHWWFYRPDVRFLTERCPDQPAARTGPGPAVSAIVGFRDQLAARGIHLLVLPMPGKPSIYPDMITRRAAPCDPRCHEYTRRLCEDLTAAGVEVTDLFHVFARARGEADPSDSAGLYLTRDTHWTNLGARRGAEAVARRLRELNWVSPGLVRYDVRPIRVHRPGDVLRMLKCPPIEALFEPEEIECLQVVRWEDGQPYRDAPESPVLVLGDSFLRIYERDEPGSAGFVAHLARQLSLPLTSIISDGGASTLVRQELSRKPALFRAARVVIWEFVERDIRFGIEGWQDVSLPTPTSRPAGG